MVGRCVNQVVVDGFVVGIDDGCFGQKMEVMDEFVIDLCIQFGIENVILLVVESGICIGNCYYWLYFWCEVNEVCSIGEVVFDFCMKVF